MHRRPLQIANSRLTVSNPTSGPRNRKSFSNFYIFLAIQFLHTTSCQAYVGLFLVILGVELGKKRTEEHGAD